MSMCSTKGECAAFRHCGKAAGISRHRPDVTCHLETRCRFMLLKKKLLTDATCAVVRTLIRQVRVIQFSTLGVACLAALVIWCFMVLGRWGKLAYDKWLLTYALTADWNVEAKRHIPEH
eukprot:6198043-Pleurochrysis_carterae.AAC.1